MSDFNVISNSKPSYEALAAENARLRDWFDKRRQPDYEELEAQIVNLKAQIERQAERIFDKDKSEKQIAECLIAEIKRQEEIFNSTSKPNEVKE